MGAVKVVVADDQDLIRAGLGAILATAPGLEVVGLAHDGGTAAALARHHSADMVLMDIQMPGVDGLEGLARIAAAGLATRVLMLTMFDLDEYVYAALRTGASGFLLKTTPPAELIRSIFACHAGDVLFAPEVTRKLVESYVARPPAVAGVPVELAALTSRELDVFRSLARGLSNAEIGARLYLGEPTVKTHVTRILAKLGLRDRVQAVVLAYECGLRQAGARMDP
ncbi:response regulator [Arthrobacter wenxiniae]|uniref:Response regulator transcription factor n=1 Tax=Arthrobacter wenxiniae TaxID=2713570 RepID=A0A7Y7LXN8_9MICC|nr:response regulator transcription factor [Arthrobacter wenxiniae]NVM94072.1 response regulator transcription factor [Arthrobacter wenxiniae]